MANSMSKRTTMFYKTANVLTTRRLIQPIRSLRPTMTRRYVSNQSVEDAEIDRYCKKAWTFSKIGAVGGSIFGAYAGGKHWNGTRNIEDTIEGAATGAMLGFIGGFLYPITLSVASAVGIAYGLDYVPYHLEIKSKEEAEK